MRREAVALLLVASLLVTAAPAAAGTAAADSGGAAVLLDFGNGTTYWYDLSGSGSCLELTQTAAAAWGLSVTVADGTVTALGGLADHAVGAQACAWRLYLWSGAAWQAGTPAGYASGSFAWGFYPSDAVVPAETPASRAAWTMCRGDAASTGVSASAGAAAVKSPMEWYRTYTTGFVDSSLIVVGDYLYHTTGGAYGATGSDKFGHVYCLDRLTGEEVWSYQMAYGAGYEVTSPLAVGDLLIVTGTNWNVYCFDRFTGDLLYTLALPQDYPYSSSGDIAWQGRTFFTGATTPVYDSGAVYFGTADGHIEAYSVSRADGFVRLWDYCPAATVAADGSYTGVRGCFYYHAPVVADVGGVRMLFMGSYEGYLYALDAATGAELYVQRLIDLGEANIPHKGTPGAVAGIAVTADGRLIVTCSDGGLSPQTGYAVCVDAATGRGPSEAGGISCYWKIDAMVGYATVVADGFYAYISPENGGLTDLTKADGTAVPLNAAVYKIDLDGHVIWQSGEYQLIKAALTLADGVLYANDYSAGKFYPSGGGVTALSAADGSEIWRIQLQPFSADSYSMVAPTVIDGRIYVGNDYGAVYCLSEIAGKHAGDSGEIVLDNGLYHWSWALLALAAVACLVYLYKKF